MTDKNIKQFIENIITEASLDSRIPDGIINLKECDHIRVIAENMYDACGDEAVVNEFVENFIGEGKYPERQAFNKEGWLVTFPSKEYRDRAISKGTHFMSDPTHGAGGMNLYYKTRGKQKRDKSQDTTVTDTSTEQPKKGEPVFKPSEPTKPAVAAPPSAAEPPEPAPSAPAPQGSPTKPETTPPEPAAEPVEPSEPSVPDAEPAGDDSGSSLPPASGGSTPASTAAEPTEPTAPPAPKPPAYSDLSKKFAQQKGWVVTPYGEWRNPQGEQTAVTALSDEVVPIKSVDRDELRLFVSKHGGSE